MRPIQFLTASVVTGSVSDFAQPSAIEGSTLVLPGEYSLDRAPFTVNPWIKMERDAYMIGSAFGRAALRAASPDGSHVRADA